MDAPAGVKGAVDADQAFLLDMSVNLSGGEISVTEHILDDAEIGAVFKEVGSKGVAQNMREDVIIDTRFLGSFFDDLPDTFAGELGSAVGEKEYARGRLAFFDEHRPCLFSVELQSTCSLSAERNVAGLVPLARDAQKTVLPVQLFGTKGHQLTHAQTAPVEHLQDGSVGRGSFPAWGFLSAI